jgi:hypothetical protein
MMDFTKLGALTVGALATVLPSGIARAATEQPTYTVLERSGGVELRQYSPRLVAETTVKGDEVSARNEGFRVIAGYIFGANQGRAAIAMTSPVAQSPARAETIAMTAPVAQSAGQGGEWKVQFFMPAKYTLATLPKPNSALVRITELPAQRFAVLRFSGLAGRGTVASKTEDLKAKVAALGWTVAGAPVTWFYDPPWTLPPMRRNEVALPIAPR